MLFRFAFVEFENEDDATSAMNQMDKQTVDGQQLSITYADKIPPTNSLFIKGLSYDTTEDTLKEVFSTANFVQILSSGSTESFKSIG